MDTRQPRTSSFREGKGVGKSYLAAFRELPFNLRVSYPTGATATVHCAASLCPVAFDCREILSVQM